MRKINVAVVGVTGMVGSKFLEVLTERKLPRIIFTLPQRARAKKSTSWVKNTRSSN